MGGDKPSPAKARRQGGKSVDEGKWLQATVDALASEYGWSKATIFDLYPREVNILLTLAAERKLQTDDLRQYQMAVAACVPYMKDGGKSFLKELVNKYRVFDTGEDVTKEDIDKANAMAKAMWGL